MMKKVWFVLAMLVCGFASCSDGGGDDLEPTPKPEVVTPTITIDAGILTNGLSFGVDASENTVSFSTNVDWTLSVASTTGGSTWCTASVTSGSKGTVSVKFTVTENTGYDDRSVSVTIKAGTASKTFTITQKGVEALLVTTDKYELEQEGGQIEIEVKANIEYQMEISETAKSWITESSGRALTTHKHTLTIAANEEVEKREGEIYFKSGDKVETVKVYQSGGTILMLTQDEYTVSDAGETITVDIKSNFEYGVQMPDVDWITDEASGRGMSSHTLKYVIAPNETYDSRSAEIIFYDKNSDLKDTLKVIQVQKDAIVLSKKEYDVKAEGETIEVKLSANVEFEVTMPEVDWVSQVESRALTEHTLYFKVAENMGENNRAACIVFTDKESKLSDTLIINQQNSYGYYEGIGYKDKLLGYVELYKAGVLKHFVELYIHDGGEYYTNLTKLTVVGPINGDDIKVLNKLYSDVSFELDLSDATIVEGGDSYDSYYVSTGIHTSKEIKCYTSDNEIGNYMFSKTEATAITLPKSATVIRYRAFYDSSLNIVNTGDGITTIMNGAFEDCPKLRSVNIGNGVTSIGDFAFNGCSGLMSVHMGDGITDIGNHAFSDCSSLKSVHISNSLTSINAGLFNGCSNLTEIVIPDNVTKIDTGAFGNCLSLKDVHIGKGVTEIGSQAFFCGDECVFNCYATTPPSITFDSFDSSRNYQLYVPAGCATAYESSDWGKYFTNIKEMD